MKLTRILALGLAVLLPFTAQAAMYEIEDESGLPESWAEKSLLRLTMLDTDRSDAMLLECGGEAMLLDGGSGQYRDRLYEMLERRGVTTLKYLFSSHSDNDHLHGLSYLMRSGNYQVGAFLSPNAQSYRDKAGYHKGAVSAAKNAGIEYVVIDEGDQFTLGDATLNVLRCPENWGQNNRGASALIRFGSARVLAVGDIDMRTMSWYADRYDEADLSCDILKIPHHGLATVPDDFLNAAMPEMLIVPNTYKRLYEGKRGFITWTQNTFRGSICKYSGDGAVVCVTDGTDWYIWQEENWTKKD